MIRPGHNGLCRPDKDITQGDQYSLPVRIHACGQTLTDEDLDVVEVTLGTLRKTTPEITYSSERHEWLVPLTQAETLAFPIGPLSVWVRVRFKGGDVISAPAQSINVIPGPSREELPDPSNGGTSE